MAIILILIVLRPFVRTIRIKTKSIFGTGHAAIVTPQSAVSLIFTQDISIDCTFRCRRQRLNIDNTCEAIGTIHQRSGPFQHFHSLHTIIIYLYAMFVAPLLPFLLYPIIHNQYPVISQPTNKRL